MSRFIKLALGIVGILVGCAPVAIVVTLLLHPLWRWVEATYRIESIGHSAPAEWCFGIVYFVFLVVSFSALWLLARRKKRV